MKKPLNSSNNVAFAFLVVLHHQALSLPIAPRRNQSDSYGNADKNRDDSDCHTNWRSTRSFPIRAATPTVISTIFATAPWIGRIISRILLSRRNASLIIWGQNQAVLTLTVNVLAKIVLEARSFVASAIVIASHVIREEVYSLASDGVTNRARLFLCLVLRILNVCISIACAFLTNIWTSFYSISIITDACSWGFIRNFIRITLMTVIICPICEFTALTDYLVLYDINSTTNSS